MNCHGEHVPIVDDIACEYVKIKLDMWTSKPTSKGKLKYGCSDWKIPVYISASQRSVK